MRLEKIRIQNYKSLKDVELRFEGLTTLVGPNGAGKSNCVDALGFLSEVYRHGLEMAIARRGGYENIAFRRARRSKGHISFAVEVSVSGDDFRSTVLGDAHLVRRQRPSGAVLRHSFSFRAVKQSIKADYAVLEESLRLVFLFEPEDGECSDAGREFVTILRDERSDLHVNAEGQRIAERFAGNVKGFFTHSFGEDEASEFIPPPIGKQELLLFDVPSISRLLGIRQALNYLSSFAVFHFAPEICREPGAPTPNPLMGAHGEHLPALVDWLRKKRPGRWNAVVAAMRDIIPDLDDISVQYLHDKTLGLQFHEDGVGRPWIAEDVSDGTMHTLGMLVALADPRNSAVVIEEPENSTHPWILRELVKRMRKAAKESTVVITTHSPYVIDTLKPQEICVVSRRKGATHVESLPSLAPDVVEQWENGGIRLSEFFDSGLVPAAAPGGES